MEMFISRVTMATGSSVTIATVDGIIQAEVPPVQVRWTGSNKTATEVSSAAAIMVEEEADLMEAEEDRAEAVVEAAAEEGNKQYQ